MTTASPPTKPSPSQSTSSSSSSSSSSPANQTTQRASSNVEYDTPVEAESVAAAELPPPLPLSIPEPQDECAICCFPLPLRPNESVYKECCGKTLCLGCILGQTRVLVIGENANLPLKGSKEEEREFRMIGCSKATSLCPFCNAKNVHFDDNTEFLKRLWKRIDEYNDPEAMNVLGGAYLKGKNGLSKNIKKTEELLQRSYDLGDPNAAYLLASMYHEHIHDEARSMKYLEEGGRRGHPACLSDLAIYANQAGNIEEATRHLITAARSGHDEAMQHLMECMRVQGVISCMGIGLSKDDLATILRAHKIVNDTRKSVPRDYSKRYHDWIAKRNAQDEN